MLHLTDVIIMCGRTIREHNEELREILVRLRKHKVVLSIEKCLFGVAELDFTGFRDIWC